LITERLFLRLLFKVRVSLSLSFAITQVIMTLVESI